MRLIRSLMLAVFVIGLIDTASAKDGESFDPPQAYRKINFFEYGGGPAKVYTASKLETLEVLVDREDLKVVFTTAHPPSSATRTVVAGLFVLRNKQDSWVISDQKRYEAYGKGSGAKAEITNIGSSIPRITVILWQGGHRDAYKQYATYMLAEDGLKLDLPREKRFREQVAAPNRLIIPKSQSNDD